MTEKKQTPKFAMDFVGFASYSDNMTEASIALVPDFDLKGVISTLTDLKDGSRVITLIFQRSEKKLSRTGYKLTEEWTLPAKEELKTTGPQHNGECVNPADCPREDEDCLNFPKGKCLKDWGNLTNPAKDARKEP
jgi:hypothetical protein